MLSTKAIIYLYVRFQLLLKVLYKGLPEYQGEKIFYTLSSRCFVVELWSQFCELYLPSKADLLNPDLLNELLASPAGSRLIEHILSNVKTAALDVFLWTYLADTEHYRAFITGTYTNFVFQKLLLNTSLKEPHLLSIINRLDFPQVITSSNIGVLWKISEACLRLKCCYQLFVSVKLFIPVLTYGF